MKVRRRKGRATVTPLEREIWAWHVEHYGDGLDVPETYRHLLEEVGELGAALLAPAHVQATREAADVAILLAVITRGLAGDDSGSLVARMREKLEALKKRSPARVHRREDKAYERNDDG